LESGNPGQDRCVLARRACPASALDATLAAWPGLGFDSTTDQRGAMSSFTSPGCRSPGLIAHQLAHLDVLSGPVFVCKIPSLLSPPLPVLPPGYCALLHTGTPTHTPPPALSSVDTASVQNRRKKKEQGEKGKKKLKFAGIAPNFGRRTPRRLP